MKRHFDMQLLAVRFETQQRVPTNASRAPRRRLAANSSSAWNEYRDVQGSNGFYFAIQEYDTTTLSAAFVAVVAAAAAAGGG